MKKHRAMSLIGTIIILCAALAMIAVMTPVITRKLPYISVNNLVHGRYEVYRDDNNILKERTCVGIFCSQEKTCNDQTNGCVFTPPDNVTNFVIHAVGGGGAGGSAGALPPDPVQTTVTQTFDLRYNAKEFYKDGKKYVYDNVEDTNETKKYINTFPDQMYQLTTKLGNEFQTPVTIENKEYFDWFDVIKDNFPYAVAVACGGAGKFKGNDSPDISGDVSGCDGLDYGGMCNLQEGNLGSASCSCSHFMSPREESCILNKESSGSSSWGCDTCCTSYVYTTYMNNWHDWDCVGPYDCNCGERGGGTTTYSSKPYESDSSDQFCTVDTDKKLIVKTQGGAPGGAPSCVYAYRQNDGFLKLESKTGLSQDELSSLYDRDYSLDENNKPSTYGSNKYNEKRASYQKDSVCGNNGNDGLSAVAIAELIKNSANKVVTKIKNLIVSYGGPGGTGGCVSNNICSACTEYKDKICQLDSTTCTNSAPEPNPAGNGVTHPFSGYTDLSLGGVAECSSGADIDISGKSAKCNSGSLYNYKYQWTMPQASAYLKYGEAGQAGEYQTSNSVTITGPVKVIAGKPGTWTGKEANESGKSGAKGGDTTVIGKDNSIIIIAHGGAGGQGNLSTKKYNLCLNLSTKTIKNDGCKDRDTDEITLSQTNLSNFSNISQFTSNSKLTKDIVAGSGGHGSGTKSSNNLICGDNSVVTWKNLSTTVTSKTFSKKFDDCGDYSRQYMYNTNKELKNINGKAGAVIITW